MGCREGRRKSEEKAKQANILFRSEREFELADVVLLVTIGFSAKRKQDHWVADHTRDALIAARAQTKDNLASSKPIMMIDQDGVPHGFCISE